MKKNFFKMIMALVIFIPIVAFNVQKLGGIKGRVAPADGVENIVLWVGKDSVLVKPVNGTFGFANLKEGVYQIRIKAVSPYKDTLIQQVAVKDSAITDLGTVQLLQ